MPPKKQAPIAAEKEAVAAPVNPAKKRGRPAGGEPGKKKRRKKPKQSYAIYIYKVLKQVHPDTGVCRRTLKIWLSLLILLSCYNCVASVPSRLISIYRFVLYGGCLIASCDAV